MQNNPILTSLNQPLAVEILMEDAQGNPIPQPTLDGLPLGTDDNSSTGQVALKVVVVGSSGSSPNSSASGVVTVTPSDTVDIAGAVRGLYVGGAGDIAVLMPDGTSATLTAVPVGMILPMKVQRVMSTGTTATNIVALL